MPRKRWTEEQRIDAVQQSATAQKTAEISRELGVSEQTFYTWHQRYRGIRVQALRGLIRRPRDENRMLRHSGLAASSAFRSSASIRLSGTIRSTASPSASPHRRAACLRPGR